MTDAPVGALPWAVVQHVAHEGPGLIGPVLTDAGIPFAVRRMDLGDPLPDVASIGGLVVLGGPMGVGDHAAHPWLRGERALLGAAVTAGLPVLGVCLGAQQMAVALGAEVGPAREAEVGVGSVMLTARGRLDPVFGPEYGGLADTAIPCVHWHGDTFTLPDGAVHLAASRVVPHQAIRVGTVAYGLQFHVEVDTALAESWRPLLPDGVDLDAAALSRVQIAGRRILGRFVGAARRSSGVEPV